jgi:hypothetical protein
VKWDKERKGDQREEQKWTKIGEDKNITESMMCNRRCSDLDIVYQPL